MKTSPRPPIEREYLAALAAAVPLDAWKAICERAAADAAAGNAKAREWLSKQLLGREPPTLLTIVASDAAQITVEKQIQQQAKTIKDERLLASLTSCFGGDDE